MTRWSVWVVKRLVIPIAWFASTIYVARPALQDPLLELLAGAVVLGIWAVVADWPGRNA